MVTCLYVSCLLQLTACKVDDMVEYAKNMLAKGHCVVIGLQSTGEISSLTGGDCSIAEVDRPLILSLTCKR